MMLVLARREDSARGRREVHRENNTGIRPMTDSDFNPTDAAGLAAWFARAEANAAGLRRRLDDLGGEWQDPAPESVRQAAETGVGAQGTGWTATTLPAGKAAVRVRIATVGHAGSAVMKVSVTRLDRGCV
jgi:hypothetical protein